MSKPRLLLSGLGGSLFPYLHKKLIDTYEIFYVDADHTLRELYPDYNFFPAPLVTDLSYPQFIKDIISRHSIDVYIPLIDEEIEIAHRIKSDLPELKLLSPSLSFCRMAMRKDILMKQLKTHNISSIPTWTGDNFKFDNNLKYFIKPISGRGSRGIRKIQTAKELEAYYVLEKYLPSEILIQELITGQEYTVGALINKFDEVVMISSRRILSKKGITMQAITENNEVIDKVVLKINEHLKPKGPINIQLYLTPDGDVKIFEINPRFSTTTIMSYEEGIDEIGLWLAYRERKFNRQPIRPKGNLVLRRRWENIFYERN